MSILSFKIATNVLFPYSLTHESKRSPNANPKEHECNCSTIANPKTLAVLSLHKTTQAKRVFRFVNDGTLHILCQNWSHDITAEVQNMDSNNFKICTYYVIKILHNETVQQSVQPFNAQDMDLNFDVQYSVRAFLQQHIQSPCIGQCRLAHTSPILHPLVTHPNSVV